MFNLWDSVTWDTNGRVNKGRIFCEYGNDPGYWLIIVPDLPNPAYKLKLHQSMIRKF